MPPPAEEKAKTPIGDDSRRSRRRRRARAGATLGTRKTAARETEVPEGYASPSARYQAIARRIASRTDVCGNPSSRTARDESTCGAQRIMRNE